MGFAINVVFIIGSIVLLAISGGFSTDAARRITEIANWDNNSNLEQAHKYLTAAAIVTWISIALVILLLVLYFIYGSETIETTGKLVTNILLFIVLTLVILIGILSAIGAANINSSNVSDNKGSYRQAIIAACLSLGVIGIMVILWIARSAYKHKDKEPDAYLIHQG